MITSFIIFYSSFVLILYYSGGSDLPMLSEVTSDLINNTNSSLDDLISNGNSSVDSNAKYFPSGLEERLIDLVINISNTISGDSTGVSSNTRNISSYDFKNWSDEDYYTRDIDLWSLTINDLKEYYSLSINMHENSNIGFEKEYCVDLINKISTQLDENKTIL
jgi:hypothetical protein